MTKNKLLKNIGKVLKNEYYTNHGPLVKSMELMLEKKTGFKNAITVSNYLISISILIDLYNVKNIFFEKNLVSKTFKNFISQNVDILNKPSHNSLNFYKHDDMKNHLLKSNIIITEKLIFNEKKIKKNIYIYNLESKKCAEQIFTGSVIFLNDNKIAEKLRNIRSSYGKRRNVNVFRSCNGRFSEIQAAMYLSKF